LSNTAAGEGRTFYKYQSVGAATACLTNQTMRWSTPATFNDPFDIQFDLASNVNEAEVLELALDKLWSIYAGRTTPAPASQLGNLIAGLGRAPSPMDRTTFDKEFARALLEGMKNGNALVPQALKESRGLLADSKVLCLTESPESPLMWAHYADSHRGVALRIRSVPGRGSPYQLAQPMRYMNQIPRLFDEETMSDIISGLKMIDVNEILNKQIYTKSSDWAYEREWRVFAGSGRNASALYEDVPFLAEELNGVLLGARMSDNDKTALTNLVRQKYPNAQILEAKLLSGFQIATNPVR
jgi:hypothetical protein